MFSSRWRWRQLRHREQCCDLNTWATKLQSPKYVITAKLGDELPRGGDLSTGTEQLGHIMVSITPATLYYFVYDQSTCSLSELYLHHEQLQEVINLSIYKELQSTREGHRDIEFLG